MKRKRYTSDLTDQQWTLIEPLIPKAKTKPRKHCIREILNAIFYLQKNGCSWRDIPHDFPHWAACRYYYDEWKKTEGWQRVTHILSQQYRESVGKDADPSVLLVDSQSVKTTFTGGTKGYDGGKKN